MTTSKHNGHDGQRRPEEIQAEIQRTRTELDETLSAIERRLTPGQIMDQGLDYLRGSSAREYVRNLGESVKREPIPLALVGVGLAWLMLSDRRSRPAPYAPYDEYDTGDASPSVTERMSDAKRRLQDTTHSAGDRISGAADSARERAAQAADSARQMAGTVREKASMAAGTARDRMAQAAGTARHQAERVRSGYDHLVQEQPLALGAIGLAIGALLGAAAPRTRQEDRMMGAASDRLAHDLKDAAREPLDRAAHAASTAADTAVDAFKSSPSDPSSQSSSTQSAMAQSRSPSVSSSSTSYGTRADGGPGPQESGPGVSSPHGYAAEGANARSDLDVALDDRPAVGGDLTPSDDRRPGVSPSDPLAGR